MICYGAHSPTTDRYLMSSYVGCIEWSQALIEQDSSAVIKIILFKGGQADGTVIGEMTKNGFYSCIAGRKVSSRAFLRKCKTNG